MASPEQTTLTRREAAELLDTSERNLRRLIEQAFPQLPVISYNEIVPGIRVETAGMVT